MSLGEEGERRKEGRRKPSLRTASKLRSAARVLCGGITVEIFQFEYIFA